MSDAVLPGSTLAVEDRFLTIL